MIYEHIVRREPLDKGWSADKKYRALDDAGNVYLLRVCAMERLKRRRAEFARMQQVAALGVPMSQALEFGTCPEGVYTISRWIDGFDA